MNRQHHPFAPLIDENSTILILGSFPSVKSRETNFYYGHPQNRFWKIIAALTHHEVPVSVEEKKAMLRDAHIALWDSIESCLIHSSSDSSIREVVPHDIAGLVRQYPIRAIYCNGQASYKYYRQYQEKQVGIKAVVLPSSSPANARMSLEMLIEAWGKIIVQ